MEVELPVEKALPDSTVGQRKRAASREAVTVAGFCDLQRYQVRLWSVPLDP